MTIPQHSEQKTGHGCWSPLFFLGIGVVGMLLGCGGDTKKSVPPAALQTRAVVSANDQELVFTNGTKIPMPEGAPGCLLTIPGLTVTQAEPSPAGLAIQAVSGNKMGHVTTQLENKLQTSGWQPTHQLDTGTSRERAYRRGNWAVLIYSWEEGGVTHTMMQMEEAEVPPQSR